MESIEQARKTKNKEKKARQRSRKVICKCKLCKGKVEIAIRTAGKHLKLYGPFEISSNDNSIQGVVGRGPLEITESTGSFDELDHESILEDCETIVSTSTSSDLSSEHGGVSVCSSDHEGEYIEVDLEQSNEELESSSCMYEEALYNTERAKIPLFSNSDQTVLQTLCRYFLWFSEHPGVSKSSLSDLLSLQHQYVLPADNNLPSSYDDAFKFIEPFLLPLDNYHVCPNHCVVFRDSPRFKYKNLNKCPECGSPRYVGNNPRNSFHYYPVGPRWKRMYGDATISELLQSHKMPSTDHDVDGCGMMRDIHDSPQFLEAFTSDGKFCGDQRGLALQFSTDGMNPFSHGTYSMWPLTLTMLNLPKKVRHLFSSIMLVGIIPGQQRDGALKIDAYLEILVDELCELSGVKFYDGFLKESFTFKVMILNHVLDYPGLNKLFSAYGANAIQACMWCEIEGTYIESLDKTVYLGNRRYLPKDCEMRLDTEKFPDKIIEKREAPPKKEFSDIMVDSVAYESAPNAAQARNIARGSGVKSCYSLMLLPDHDRTTQAFPDVMHTTMCIMLYLRSLI
ncbi:uncharacterized protein LOC110239599 isoform X1 [Exaiptasia diaphana]|uniref:Transposase n=1 Tax=Exaiptasia diaphana TaxID=2652724 RepID=A0A913YL43_EXADI|nr:uncharacterized protein LOC110239599 isoform X1 [Exaiptasia diaphana]XP_028515011.1 uncharacterized protein LOC110239599 isoform X1 [Exaiptasia diaphana]